MHEVIFNWLRERERRRGDVTKEKFIKIWGGQTLFSKILLAILTQILYPKLIITAGGSRIDISSVSQRDPVQSLHHIGHLDTA